METYGVSCKKYAENENLNVKKIKENRLILKANCAIYGKRKLNFIKNQKVHISNNIWNN